MAKSYGYYWRFEDIRDRLGHALSVYKFTRSEALGYAIVECSLLERDDAITETLSFVALAKVAMEFGYAEDMILLSDDIRERCSDSRAVAAAGALDDERERQAFQKDLAEVRAAVFR